MNEDFFSLVHMLPMKKSTPTISAGSLASRIVTLRGRKVILAWDLAALYGVKTSALSRAVERDPRRFRIDCVFQLTRAEAGACGQDSGFPPYAFTQKGAVMAAYVLNSPQAIRVSIFVVRATVRMRELVSDSLAMELKAVEDEFSARLDVHEKAIVKAFRLIMELLDAQPTRLKKCLQL